MGGCCLVKREISYLGVPVVFGNERMVFDERREFLVDCLFLYAHKRGRDVKIIFFNGDEGDTGGAAIFKDEDDS